MIVMKATQQQCAVNTVIGNGWLLRRGMVRGNVAGGEVAGSQAAL